jgi:hypothetical protein
MVAPPEMDPPYPMSRNNAHPRNGDPELARALQQIREQDERERQQDEEELIPEQTSSNAWSSRSRISPPEMDPPYPRSRNIAHPRNDDPELEQLLQQMRVLCEQEREHQQEEEQQLSLALALSLQMEDNCNSLISLVDDDAFVSLPSATPLPRPPQRRRPPPPPVEGPVFRSIYDEDELPFVSQPRRRAPSTGTREVITHWGEEPGSTYQADRHRFHDADNDGPSLRVSEGWVIEDQQLDADLELALRIQAEEAEFEAANALFIESLGQQEVFDCVMCMEKNPVDDVAIVDGCGHRFCRNCLRQYLTTKLSEANFPIPCPTCSADKNQENPGGSLWFCCNFWIFI